MKRLTLTILVTFIAVFLRATTYYVATNGNDNNSGTILQPWATFQWAFDNVVAGDTVYFRGGVYFQSSYANTGGLSGTEVNPIVFMGYPDDIASGNRPIIDGNRTSNQGGILCSGSHYLKFFGFVIRNFVQINKPSGTTYDHPFGFYLYRSTNVIIENCEAYEIQYRPYWIWECDEVYIINCDAHDIYDPLSDNPGNHADGFFVWDGLNNPYGHNAKVYLQGCRAWRCADNGYDIQGDFYIQVDGCWAFDCGHVPGFEYGRGSGFVFGYPSYQATEVTRKISNCIAAFNNTAGFATSDAMYSYTRPQEIFNNISYHNGYPSDADGIGFSIFNTNTSDNNELLRVYRNNIAYNNEDYDVFVNAGSLYTHSNNSWDISGLTISDADFISVDSTGITAPRQANGSFPDNNCYKNFLKLAPGSDLIDRGVDVGLPYFGSAPDIGYSEYAPEPVIRSSILRYGNRWIIHGNKIVKIE